MTDDNRGVKMAYHLAIIVVIGFFLITLCFLVLILTSELNQKKPYEYVLSDFKANGDYQINYSGQYYIAPRDGIIKDTGRPIAKCSPIFKKPDGVLVGAGSLNGIDMVPLLQDNQAYKQCMGGLLND